MKIVAVVPMKLNNQRLPNKNTKRFADGTPLCYYILDTLSQNRWIDEIYVYCSDGEITRYLFGNIKYLKRDKKFDSDSTTMNEVLVSFSDIIPADIYVMAHATAPFISLKALDHGIEAVASGRYDSALSVKKLQDFIWKDGKPLNYHLDNIPRTQDLSPLYMETSGFYVYKSHIIRQKGRRIGDNPCLVEVGEIESCDIDEEEDFMIADAIQTYLKKGNNRDE